MTKSMPDVGRGVDQSRMATDERPWLQIRVTGTRADCEAAVEALRDGLKVDHVSRPVRTDGGLYNVYVEAFVRQSR